MTIMNNPIFINAAFDIGCQFIKNAVWHKDNCTWLGENIQDVYNQKSLVYENIGLDIYSGVSGIALFLTQLYRNTEDQIIKEAITGAINTLIENYSLSPYNLNYHFGKLGIITTILFSAETLGREDWSKFGKANLNMLLQERIENFETEILMGISGTISPLLLLWKKYNEDIFINKLREIGDYIIDKANRYDTYWNWDSHISDIPLTGYSHGVSGIVKGLLDIYEVTEEAKYLNAAIMGIAYENNFYNAAVKNWVDLRELEGANQSSFMVAWCHGAPGIALSRIRAWQLTQDTKYKNEAFIALETTMTQVYTWLNEFPSYSNFSLCHGLAGNADILLTGGIEMKIPTFKNAAYHTGQYGIEKYAQPGIIWPGGLNDPSTNFPIDIPGLMLGNAGIGSFYLRLGNPELPPIL
jgi:lantibiotic modifying enzyme